MLAAIEFDNQLCSITAKSTIIGTIGTCRRNCSSGADESRSFDQESPFDIGLAAAQLARLVELGACPHPTLSRRRGEGDGQV